MINNSFRNILIVIFLILLYQSAGIYLSIFVKPKYNLYLVPILQALILLLPVWFLSGTNYDERISFLSLKLEKLNYNTIILLLIIAIAYQFFYNSFNFIQEKLLSDTYFQNFINLKELSNNSIERFFLDDKLIHYFYGLIAVALIPSIIEEIVFRGYLQNSLFNKSNSVKVIITSVIFSLSHLNPMDFIPIFLFSLILGALLINKGNIIYPIILHFFLNAQAFIGIMLDNKLNLDSFKEINIINHILILITMSAIIMLSLRHILLNRDY